MKICMQVCAQAALLLGLGSCEWLELQLQDSHYVGSYSVPVASELRPYSQYPLEQITWKTEEGLELGYSVPAELTGVLGNAIVLEGETPPTDENEAFVLNSKNFHRAICQWQNDWVECRVEYGYLKFEPEHREDILLLTYSEAAPEEREGRHEVAAYFEGDPVGIVRFKAPRSAQK